MFVLDRVSVFAMDWLPLVASLWHHLFSSSPPWVNFNNILQAAYTRSDPKSAKKDNHVKQLFALSGSAWVKAARTIVGEIDPSLLLFLLKTFELENGYEELIRPKMQFAHFFF